MDPVGQGTQTPSYILGEASFSLAPMSLHLALCNKFSPSQWYKNSSASLLIIRVSTP